MKDISALKKAVSLVAHAISDAVDAADEPTAMQKMLKFQNLIPDLVALLPEIGDIPQELEGADAESYAALIAELGQEMVLPVGKSEKLVKGSLKLLSDIALVIVPDVLAIIAASKEA